MSRTFVPRSSVNRNSKFENRNYRRLRFIYSYLPESSRLALYIAVAFVALGGAILCSAVGVEFWSITRYATKLAA
jgi:hypothetical protein